jgi:hypothetical protein
LIETMYRVDTFRRFLPNRGTYGLGLVQFFGPKARRRYKIGAKAPKWEVGLDSAMHTLEVDHSLIIK